MRILIDMQGAQTESRFRGIGRYTLAFAQAVARTRGEHEVLLLLSEQFPDSLADIRNAFADLLPAHHMLSWSAPLPWRAGSPDADLNLAAALRMRDALIAALAPDVVHISSPFEGFADEALVSLGRLNEFTQSSCTLYDLIPLLYPRDYLDGNPAYARFYRDRVAALRDFPLLLAISESARDEACSALGLDGERVVNIAGAVDDRFRRLDPPQAEVASALAALGINRSFVLYTGGSDERKNLPRLIEAYAGLSRELRARHQLVLAGKMPHPVVTHLSRLARDQGLSERDLVFTGYITDEQLVLLYNVCALYVFPSWHEGFGLPVLEAMACSAPVVGANTSSLPEVIGWDEAMFDPYDVRSIRAKLEQALTDEVFRERLRAHGQQQVQAFSWEETAHRAWRAWTSHGVAAERPSAAAWPDLDEGLRAQRKALLGDLAAVAVQAGLARGDGKLLRWAQCIDHNEAQLLRFFRPKALPSVLDWRIEGPFDSSYSLAAVNREVATALSQLGHRVALHSTEGPGDFEPSADVLRQRPDLAEMHQRSAQLSPADADVVSRNLYPPRVHDMRARLNALHAYGWEESGFPSQWVDDFNEHLQGMTVMSNHVKSLMINNGVSVPIAVSGLGVDHWSRIEVRTRVTLQAKAFRFLHVSSCFPRKGVDVLLRAYGQAFRASDDVSLVIKTFANPHNRVAQDLARVREQDPGFPDVVLIEADYSEEQLKSLYEQCQALVAPSRAEGFGLPMAEALCSGLAVITTAWGGQTDFCTPETSWLIDYRFERAKTHFEVSDSLWAEPDETHLAQLMQEVHDAPPHLRSQRILAGQRSLAENHQWRHVAQRMVAAAHDWSIADSGRSARIAWVSTWNVRCGIAAYSRHLVNAMPERVAVLAAHSAELIEADGENVSRCWSPGEGDDLSGLAAMIDAQNSDTVVVQFNYGFFEFTQLARFLTQQCEAGRVVVVVMHATQDPEHVPHKRLASLAEALRACARVLVHSPHDMNRLKQLGVDAVALFPHGVVDFQAPPPQRRLSRPWVLGSYGFALPHKGLVQLVEALALLRQRGRRVCLKLWNAAYPVAESQATIDEVNAAVSRLGLQQVVSFDTAYAEDAESLQRLASVDLLVFPYQRTGESSSAAVRMGLASQRPVAVTPLDIFDDVRSATHALPGVTPHDMAEGLDQLMARLESGDQQAELIADAAATWRAEHGYSRLGQRMYRMLCALRMDSSRAVPFPPR